MRDASRGQSEVVGTVLLAGAVVLTVSFAGVAILGAIDTEDGQLTDVAVMASTDAVTVSHAGGEPIAAADLAVVVEFEAASERYTAADEGVPTPFETDDRWTIDTGLPYTTADQGAYVSVTVIATNTGDVLYTDAVQIS